MNYVNTMNGYTVLYCNVSNLTAVNNAILRFCIFSNMHILSHCLISFPPIEQKHNNHEHYNTGLLIQNTLQDIQDPYRESSVYYIYIFSIRAAHVTRGSAHTCSRLVSNKIEPSANCCMSMLVLYKLRGSGGLLLFFELQLVFTRHFQLKGHFTGALYRTRLFLLFSMYDCSYCVYKTHASFPKLTWVDPDLRHLKMLSYSILETTESLSLFTLMILYFTQLNKVATCGKESDHRR